MFGRHLNLSVAVVLLGALVGCGPEVAPPPAPAVPEPAVIEYDHVRYDREGGRWKPADVSARPYV